MIEQVGIDEAKQAFAELPANLKAAMIKIV